MSLTPSPERGPVPRDVDGVPAERDVQRGWQVPDREDEQA
jgi:hypothetical protein